MRHLLRTYAQRLLHAARHGQRLAVGLAVESPARSQPGYTANLVTGWLPALDDVLEKLSARATVVDVGNGHGARRHPRRMR
ncbi:MAG TPA: hypothetical protein VF241_08680 [Propionibacteriaceae bacterium]